LLCSLAPSPFQPQSPRCGSVSAVKPVGALVLSDQRLHHFDAVSQKVGGPWRSSWIGVVSFCRVPVHIPMDWNPVFAKVLDRQLPSSRTRCCL
jgi:hypothetical protein